MPRVFGFFIAQGPLVAKSPHVDVRSMQVGSDESVLFIA
jgi:hypothetical protein